MNRNLTRSALGVLARAVAGACTGDRLRPRWSRLGGRLSLVLPLLLISVTGCTDDPVAPQAESSLTPGEANEAVAPADLLSDIHAASGRRYIAVSYLSGGKRAYIDRTYTYQSVPDLVRGQVFIRTANGDQAVSGNGSFLTFQLKRQSLVYIAYNGKPPAWVTERGFKPTGERLVIAKEREKKTHDLYVRAYSAGKVTLGSNRAGSGSAEMYTVIIRPQELYTTAVSTGSGFSSIVEGVRPRGYGKVTYTLLQPKTGGRTYYVDPNGSDSNPGTYSAPFRTINKAAQVAKAGDVVNIRPGTYRESVRVRNGGTAGRPIVFQATGRGKVVLTGGSYNFTPAEYYGGVKNYGAIHVTLRGLVFRNYAPLVSDIKRRAAVAAIRGWKIEECLFDAAGYSGLDIRGDSVTVVRSTFLNHHTLAVTASAETWQRKLRRPRLIDVIIRGNHTRPDPLYGDGAMKVMKFYHTADAVVDNVESYENFGPGIWFDTNNTNYVVRNSYLHHNYGESGRGLFIEVSKSPGLVENNIFAGNSVSGVTVANSTGVTINHNLFVRNARSIHLVDEYRKEGYDLGNVRITRNAFKGWQRDSNIHPGGSRIKTRTPAQMNLMADYNTYDPGTVPEMSYWKQTGWLRSVSELRSKLGWEQNGRVGTVTPPM